MRERLPSCDVAPVKRILPAFFASSNARAISALSRRLNPSSGTTWPPPLGDDPARVRHARMIRDRRRHLAEAPAPPPPLEAADRGCGTRRDAGRDAQKPSPIDLVFAVVVHLLIVHAR